MQGPELMRMTLSLEAAVSVDERGMQRGEGTAPTFVRIDRWDQRLSAQEKAYLADIAADTEAQRRLRSGDAPSSAGGAVDEQATHGAGRADELVAALFANEVEDVAGKKRKVHVGLRW